MIPLSSRTFYRQIKQRAGYEQTKARQGAKAAYAQEPWILELSQTTPRHGNRPFAIVHIDHTELDVVLVSSVTGKPLGKPWVTFLVDAHSRRILSVYLTFDPPSYRSCMMALRICVQRFGRMPGALVVDGGREFHSTYFDALLLRYHTAKKDRPGAKPHFGSVIERLFGTTNTEFVFNLLGNTQAAKRPANSPKRSIPEARRCGNSLISMRFCVNGPMKSTIRWTTPLCSKAREMLLRKVWCRLGNETIGLFRMPKSFSWRVRLRPARERQKLSMGEESRFMGYIAPRSSYARQRWKEQRWMSVMTHSTLESRTPMSRTSGYGVFLNTTRFCKGILKRS